MDKKISNIKERILYLADFKGVAKEKFFTEIGMTYGSFKGKQKNTALNSDALDKILSIYPDVDALWLITGNGSMTKGIDYKIPDENPQLVAEPKSVYKLKTDKVVTEHQQIPLYNIEATAGIVTLFRDTDQTQPIDFIQVPNLPKCDGALYVTGDSMYPLLKSGDIVMYKQVHNIRDGIFWGEMYLISIVQDGDEMVLVKYIQKSEKGDDWIRLVSQNQHHQDKDIKLTKVKALALVKASIRINSML